MLINDTYESFFIKPLHRIPALVISIQTSIWTLDRYQIARNDSRVPILVIIFMFQCLKYVLLIIYQSSLELLYFIYTILFVLLQTEMQNWCCSTDKNDSVVTYVLFNCLNYPIFIISCSELVCLYKSLYNTLNDHWFIITH